MTRILALAVIVAVAGLALYGGVTLFDETLQVGRMWETPGIKPHEKPIPVMAVGSVPWSEAEQIYRVADPDGLRAPFLLTDPAAVSEGARQYMYYCSHCHGRHHDGLGTVGQSFAPLPGDLRSARVQTLPGGRIFHEISYGIPDGRQPALATTISLTDRWRIIAFVKSLGVRP